MLNLQHIIVIEVIALVTNDYLVTMDAGSLHVVTTVGNKEYALNKKYVHKRALNKSILG